MPPTISPPPPPSPAAPRPNQLVGDVLHTTSAVFSMPLSCWATRDMYRGKLGHVCHSSDRMSKSSRECPRLSLQGCPRIIEG